MNKRTLGIYLTIAGFLLILLTNQNLTGAVIETTGSAVTNIIGALILLAGIILIVITEHEPTKSGLGKVIIKTAAFEKSIKGHDIGAIQRAIDKIGTGSGKEEVLKYMKPYHSIRESHGGRVIFERKPNGEIVLAEYLPKSKHY